MMKHEKEKPKSEHELELAGPFFAVLFLLMLVGFLIPLRPENSERERRKLHEFPPFSVRTLLDGSYFDEISAWYSDTFPGREDMLEISDRLNALHGIGKNEVQLTQLSGTDNDNAALDALLEEAEAAAPPAGNEGAAAPEESPAAQPTPNRRPDRRPRRGDRKLGRPERRGRGEDVRRPRRHRRQCGFAHGL